MSRPAVEFKGTKEGVTIFCLDGANFEDIISNLKTRLQQRAAFFAEAEVRVDVGSRQLTSKEKELLADVISNYSKMKLAAIQTLSDRQSAITADRGSASAADAMREGYREGRSLVIKRTLRSGQSIHFPGHVIVLGDVNPAAEIVAEGDIFVFGTMRGNAHAGVSGDRSASVAALKLAPTQLRIADVISRSPDEDTLPDHPEYAFISENRIMIASVTTKFGM